MHRPCKENVERFSSDLSQARPKFDVTKGKVISHPKVLFMHSNINDETSYELKVEGKGILLKRE